MSRNISLASGEFYHIYNRGTEKRDIFLDKQNYERFLSLLYICNSTKPVDIKLQGRTLDKILNTKRKETLVDICAYCLMPNHFHLIIHEHTENGISKFAQKILTAYTMYFNKKNDRSGALFQGKFKASYIDDDVYLAYLLSYIHLNPIKLLEPLWKESGIKNKKSAELFLKDYQYSSFLDYTGEKRLESCIINKSAFPKYFDTPIGFEKSVTEWLDYNTF